MKTHFLAFLLENWKERNLPLQILISCILFAPFVGELVPLITSIGFSTALAIDTHRETFTGDLKITFTHYSKYFFNGFTNKTK